MTVCSSRRLQYGCLYCLLSATTKQQQSSWSARVVLQLKKHLGTPHSQRAKVALLGIGALGKALLSQSLMQGFVWNRSNGERPFLMAERVSSFTKFPGVFATEFSDPKITLSLYIQPCYSTSNTSPRAGELTATSVKAEKVLTSAAEWSVRVGALAVSPWAVWCRFILHVFVCVCQLPKAMKSFFMVSCDDT